MVDQPSGRGSSSRAAEIAAQQVESIVAAAQAAADQLRLEAQRDSEAMIAAGEQEAAQHLDRAKAEAIRLGQDASRESEQLRTEAQRAATELRENAEREAAELRERNRAEVQERVAAAEQAAEQVLEEARTLSGGLRQLGQMLGNQGERILRDVQAAHKRMQSDLRVAPGPAPSPPPARRSAPRATPSGEEDEALETLRRAVSSERGRGSEPEPRETPEPRTRPRERRNPIDDLEVPNWVDPP